MDPNNGRDFWRWLGAAFDPNLFSSAHPTKHAALNIRTLNDPDHPLISALSSQYPPVQPGPLMATAGLKQGAYDRQLNYFVGVAFIATIHSLHGGNHGSPMFMSPSEIVRQLLLSWSER